MKCSKCNGKGSVVNPSWTPGIGCEPYWSDCPKCGGSGQTPDASPPQTVRTFTINGKEHKVTWPPGPTELSYASLVALAEMTGRPSMTVKGGAYPAGAIIDDGDTVNIQGVENFNVCHTGNA